MRFPLHRPSSQFPPHSAIASIQLVCTACRRNSKKFYAIVAKFEKAAERASGATGEDDDTMDDKAEKVRLFVSKNEDLKRCKQRIACAAH